MLELLLPSRCVLCDDPGGGLCGRCAASLAPPLPRPRPAGLDALVSLCDYQGTGRDLVLGLKRRNRRACLPLLGAALAEALRAEVGSVLPGSRPDERAHLPDVPVTVTWAPTTTTRRRRRGFDQSEMLARSVADAAHWSVRGLLTRSGPAQMGRTGDQRRSGVGFVSADSAPPVVALIDDVVTSGATMSAAARALRGAGATTVVGGAIALAAGQVTRA